MKVAVQLHILTAALVEVCDQLHTPTAPLPGGKSPEIDWIRGWMGIINNLNTSGGEKNLISLPTIKARFLGHPVRVLVTLHMFFEACNNNFYNDNANNGNRPEVINVLKKVASYRPVITSSPENNDTLSCEIYNIAQKNKAHKQDKSHKNLGTLQILKFKHLTING
jgi:hypothetical protein